MLRSLRELERCSISASDGDIGTVASFLIDDATWSVRFLVVRTGGPMFLAGHHVMIERTSFGAVDWSAQLFHLDLTRDQVRNSQVTDPHYPHLKRSDKELRRFHIEGTDGGIGHIADFIVDDETWQVDYLVVDTSNWLVGKKVLVAAECATQVSWPDEKVFIAMSREAIKDSPSWQTGRVIGGEYEESLHAYYGRPTYWGSGDPPSSELDARKANTQT